MVFISISISLARRNAPPTPTRSTSYTESMSSIRHGSISSYSVRSHSDTPPAYLYKNTCTGVSDSLERLIPTNSRTTRLLERDRRRVRMATTHENGVLIERKMSYGIGGAGNIRKYLAFGG